MKVPHIRTLQAAEADFVCNEVLPALGTGPFRIEDRVLMRRDSAIFRASSPASATALAVKIYDPVASKPGAAEKLYASLRKYESRDKFTVPRAYAFVEKHHAVVMEWIEAPRFGDTLLRLPPWTGKRREQVTLAGEWLRWFHATTDVRQAPYDGPKALRKIEKIAARSETATGCTDKNLQKCFTLLRQAASHFDRQPVTHADVHDDFTPYNIFILKEGAAGFDFTAGRKGPILRDICRFLVYLDTHKYLPTTAADLQAQGCNRADFEAFTQGYGADPDKSPEGFLLYMQLTEIVRLWVANMTRRRAVQGLIRSLETRRLRRMALHVSQALEKKLPAA